MHVFLILRANQPLAIFDRHPNTLGDLFIGELIENAVTPNHYKITFFLLESKGPNLRNGYHYLRVSAQLSDLGF
jgi:hypothetical protein